MNDSFLFLFLFRILEQCFSQFLKQIMCYNAEVYTELVLEILVRPHEYDSSLHWTLWPQL